MKILAVRVIHKMDDSPDLSFIGEYHGANKVKPHTIDRKARGDMGRNEYQYFTPTMTAEQTGNPDSPEHDYQRMEAYNRGDWGMIGIWAEADVQTHNHGVIQKIRSGGLWGIESDSGAEYLKEVEREQLNELSSELQALTFSKRTINKAFKDVKVKD